MMNNSSSWVFNLYTGTRSTSMIYPQYAQYDNIGYGPTFGGGHDLYCSNVLGSCYANQHSYTSNPAVGYVSGTASDLEVFY